MTVQPLVIGGYEKDTADQLNGLERPKPNEGYALENGVSNTNVAQRTRYVKRADIESAPTIYQGDMV